MPYRIAGKVTREGGTRVVLAKGDRVFMVREGDVLDDLYRVASIRPDGVTLVYVPLQAREQLAVTGTLRLEADQAGAAVAAPTAVSAPPAAQAIPHAAQLRWEGPERVRAGSDFDVALRLTSDQPVGALPLQLSFDAQRLQPVAVRPGKLFAAGNFVYRINPLGSIFVGASGNGSVAKDERFLVMTFRSIRSGAAELKLSSLLLRSAGGTPILYAPPRVFKTAVVQ
jgi:Cohesin domain